jgi:hypothetical protein
MMRGSKRRLVPVVGIVIVAVVGAVVNELLGQARLYVALRALDGDPSALGGVSRAAGPALTVVTRVNRPGRGVAGWTAH